MSPFSQYSRSIGLVVRWCNSCPRGPSGAVDAISGVVPLEAEHVQVRAQRPAEGDQSRLQYLLPRDVHRSRIGILRAIVGQVSEEDGREVMLALGEPHFVEECLTPLAHFLFRVRRVCLLVCVLDLLLLLLTMIPRQAVVVKALFVFGNDVFGGPVGGGCGGGGAPKEESRMSSPPSSRQAAGRGRGRSRWWSRDDDDGSATTTTSLTDCWR